jgi:hypothetical protein
LKNEVKAGEKCKFKETKLVKMLHCSCGLFATPVKKCINSGNTKLGDCKKEVSYS